METRAQKRARLSMDDYDFDAASKAWKKNKKRLDGSEGCYEYRCSHPRCFGVVRGMRYQDMMSQTTHLCKRHWHKS